MQYSCWEQTLLSPLDRLSLHGLRIFPFYLIYLLFGTLTQCTSDTHWELASTYYLVCVGHSLNPHWLYIHLQVKHPLRDWRKLRECCMDVMHSPESGEYGAAAVNSESENARVSKIDFKL